jgi:membrane-bound lytic murein transglycosylase D
MKLGTALPVAVALGAVLGVSTAWSARGSDSGPAEDQAVRVLETLPAPVVSWDIPVVRNEPVQRFVRLLAERQPDRMSLYLKRSGRYEGMIRAKLRERGMPEDLLYLSMIESGFNPTARSKAHAVGLWQFVDETARRYGLRIDAYVDERRDPEKSTDAALRYLADLYARFGSWYLAAAAYNSGENRVGRIMVEETGSERGREADFWRIRHRLPSETREYVPLMVAAALVGKEPERYGMERVERWLPEPTERVEVPGGLSLDSIGRDVGLPGSEIRALNPELVRGVTPPGASYAVRVPAGRRELVATRFPSPPVAGSERSIARP